MRRFTIDDGWGPDEPHDLDDLAPFCDYTASAWRDAVEIAPTDPRSDAGLTQWRRQLCIGDYSLCAEVWRSEFGVIVVELCGEHVLCPTMLDALDLLRRFAPLLALASAEALEGMARGIEERAS